RPLRAAAGARPTAHGPVRGHGPGGPGHRDGRSVQGRVLRRRVLPPRGHVLRRSLPRGAGSGASTPPGRPVRVLDDRPAVLGLRRSGDRRAGRPAPRCLLRDAPVPVVRVGAAPGRVQAAVRGLDRAVPPERPRDRGPDRAPDAGGRHVHLPHGGRARMGPPVAGRAHLEAPQGGPVSRYDAVVIGAGHNGMVTAAYLAKAGRRTVGLEERESPGGAVATARLADGVLAPALAHTVGRLRTRVIRDLNLERHGLRLVQPGVRAFAPQLDGRALTLWGDP